MPNSSQLCIISTHKKTMANTALQYHSGPRIRIGQANSANRFESARGAPRPPRGAKVGGPTWGPSQKFGTQKIKKIKILKINIRSAQNVGKVWISRKKSSWAHLGPSGPIFCVGRKNRKNAEILPIFLGGPMGPIHPVWGPCCYPPEVGQ